mgnify:FL=1
MIALIANVPADQTLSSGLIFGRLLMGASVNGGDWVWAVPRTSRLGLSAQ